MKRGFVVTVAGAAIVVAGLAGCSSNKASNGSSTAAGGQGSAKITIDGKEQTVSGSIGCVTNGNTINVALGSGSGGAMSAVLTTDNPPKVTAVALGNVNGMALAVGSGQGDATATKDGDKYTIKGHAVGADMANPTAGMQTKPFEIDVTCPS